MSHSNPSCKQGEMEWLFGDEIVIEEDDEDDALTIEPKDNLHNPEHLYTPEVYTSEPGQVQMIRAKRLVKTYPSGENGRTIRALDGVSFSRNGPVFPILHGEFVMIMGPQGAGKSTFLKTVGAVEMPTSGELSVFGRNVVANMRTAPQKILQLRLSYIGYVLQPPALLLNLNALENVEFPMILQACHKREFRRRRAQHLLESLGVDFASQIPVSQHSKSIQQRIALAQALANRPHLLLLDDPTNNLTHSETIDMMNYLQDYNQGDLCATIIMVTKNPLLSCYSHRLLIMKEGVIIGSKPNRARRRLDKAKYVRHMTDQGTNMTTSTPQRSATNPSPLA